MTTDEAREFFLALYGQLPPKTKGSAFYNSALVDLSLAEAIELIDEIPPDQRPRATAATINRLASAKRFERPEASQPQAKKAMQNQIAISQPRSRDIGHEWIARARELLK